MHLFLRDLIKDTPLVKESWKRWRRNWKKKKKSPATGRNWTHDLQITRHVLYRCATTAAQLKWVKFTLKGSREVFFGTSRTFASTEIVLSKEITFGKNFWSLLFQRKNQFFLRTTKKTLSTFFVSPLYLCRIVSKSRFTNSRKKWLVGIFWKQAFDRIEKARLAQGILSWRWLNFKACPVALELIW